MAGTGAWDGGAALFGVGAGFGAGFGLCEWDHVLLFKLILHGARWRVLSTKAQSRNGQPASACCSQRTEALVDLFFDGLAS